MVVAMCDLALADFFGLQLARAISYWVTRAQF